MLFPDTSSVQNVYLGNQYMLPLRHIAKKMIYNQNKNANVFQFQAGCMTHPMMKNIRHIESGLSKYFYPHFKTKQ